MNSEGKILIAELKPHAFVKRVRGVIVKEYSHGYDVRVPGIGQFIHVMHDEIKNKKIVSPNHRKPRILALFENPRQSTLVKKDYGKWGRHYNTIKDLETERELYGDSDGSIRKEIIERRKQKRNPRDRFRQLYQIKDSHGRVHSIVGGLKLAKSHAQRYADMFDETMRIEPYKWRG